MFKLHNTCFCLRLEVWRCFGYGDGPSIYLWPSGRFGSILSPLFLLVYFLDCAWHHQSLVSCYEVGDFASLLSITHEKVLIFTRSLSVFLRIINQLRHWHTVMLCCSGIIPSIRSSDIAAWGPSSSTSCCMCTTSFPTLTYIRWVVHAVIYDRSLVVLISYLFS